MSKKGFPRPKHAASSKPVKDRRPRRPKPKFNVMDVIAAKGKAAAHAALTPRE